MGVLHPDDLEWVESGVAAQDGVEELGVDWHPPLTVPTWCFTHNKLSDMEWHRQNLRTAAELKLINVPSATRNSRRNHTFSVTWTRTWMFALIHVINVERALHTHRIWHDIRSHVLHQVNTPALSVVSRVAVLKSCKCIFCKLMLDPCKVILYMGYRTSS